MKALEIETMRTWTVDEMLAENPCSVYTRARIHALWAGRERLSLLEILGLNIPDADKIWVCCREHPQRAAWLERIVTRAVRTYALPCYAIAKWAERWLAGSDRDRTVEACYAIAEWAWAAEACAAEARARAKARAAARAKARAAEARAAGRQQQIADMRELLSQ